MTRKTLSTILTVALVGGVAAGVGITHAANTTTTKTSTPATQTKTTATTTKTAPAPAKVKVSQDQATQIALKAHKDGKVLDIQLVSPVYVIHLQTAKGKVTMKVGANTGRILADVLTAAPAAPKADAKTTNNTTKTTDNTAKTGASTSTTKASTSTTTTTTTTK